MSSHPVKYYECHITVEPVFDERLKELHGICLPYKFKVADLLMKKRSSDKEERSANDTFTTSRSPSFEEMHDRMMRCVESLKEKGFAVWRYKIEAVILDVKLKGQ